MKHYWQAAMVAVLLSCASAMAGLKDEMRQPWQRDDTSFIRDWKVAGPFKCDLARDCLDLPGGEAAAKPDSGQKRADGSGLDWRAEHEWDDSVGFDVLTGEREGAIAYAGHVSDPCDGRSNGTDAMLDSLPYRNDAAMVLRRLARSLPGRAGVLGVATCDKGLPAMMMALAGLPDVPSVVVPGGVTLLARDAEDTATVQTLAARFAQHAIRRGARRIRRRCVGHVHHDHHNRHIADREPDVLRAQHEKGFTEPGQRKDAAQLNDKPISHRQALRVREGELPAGRIANELVLGFAQVKHQQSDRDERGDHCKPHRRPDVVDQPDHHS